MEKYNAQHFKDRFKELYSQKLDDICLELNSEFDQVFYIKNEQIFVDCSDYSQFDVKIS